MEARASVRKSSCLQIVLTKQRKHLYGGNLGHPKHKVMLAGRLIASAKKQPPRPYLPGPVSGGQETPQR